MEKKGKYIDYVYISVLFSYTAIFWKFMVKNEKMRYIFREYLSNFMKQCCVFNSFKSVFS